MTNARTYGLVLLASLLFCIYTLTNAGRLHIVDEASLFGVTESLAMRGQVDTNAIAWTQWVNSPGEVLGAFGPNGEVYSKKGPAPAFVAAGWYLLLRGLTLLNIQVGMLQATLLWNGVITALTAALLWMAARRLGYRERTGLLLGLLFGLATIAWPYAKQFFGEPLSAFSLLLCFYGILSWKKDGHWQWLAAAGVGAGLAITTVSAHTVLVAILGVYLASAWWQRRAQGKADTAATLRGALAFGAPIAVAAALLLLYNWLRFGSPFDTGYHFDTGEGFTTPIWQGLWGLLFSPYRSLFLHTPLFIASVAAFVPFLRRHRAEGITIGALSLALLLIYSLWWMWWGGYAWGPRFLVPLSPFLVLLLAPVVDGLVLDSRPGDRAARWALEWGFVALVLLSGLVQLLAASINFVNYETLLRTEFFPTDWANPLAFGPPAQGLGSLLLSPVFGQGRLLARGGLEINSDLPWLWPDGNIVWTILLVGVAAVCTLILLLARWVQSLPAGGQNARGNLPTFALAVALPLIMLGTWIGHVSGDPIYGSENAGYRAVLDEVCAESGPRDSLVNVAPFAYHIPMNWMASACGRAVPVYGYALNSLEYPEARAVLERTLAESERIYFVTAGVAPNDPDNTLERWLADNAYKADDRWFDDYRLLRYATADTLESVPYTLHNLFISSGVTNGVTILASRVQPQARPGEIIPVEIQYTLHLAAVADLHWFVQVLSSAGVAVAQYDSGPADNYTRFSTLPSSEQLTENAGLQLPVDLPAGSYQVIAGIYDPGAPGAPRLRANDGREYLVLSTLEVVE